MKYKWKVGDQLQSSVDGSIVEILDMGGPKYMERKYNAVIGDEELEVHYYWVRVIADPEGWATAPEDWGHQSAMDDDAYWELEPTYKVDLMLRGDI